MGKELCYVAFFHINMNNKTIIIVQPQGGLCNRMRTICGAASLANKIHGELKVIWTKDASLNIAFGEIFESFPYKVIEVQLNSLQYKLLYHWYKDVCRYKILDDAWIYKFARGKHFDTWCKLMDQRGFFIISSADILFDGDYKIFKPNSRTLQMLNTVCCDKSTIGIHIRRTDNEMSIKHSPTQLFLRRVREELHANPDAKFYFATDDPVEEEQFLSEFGDHILVYKKHSLDRNDPMAIKDAVIDLYNLSQCRKILASYYSSFSDVAALWGNIKKEVIKCDN